MLPNRFSKCENLCEIYKLCENCVLAFIFILMETVFITSGVYVCSVFSSRTRVHARRHFNGITCTVMLCVMTACHVHFTIFSFYAHFAIFSFLNVYKSFHFSLKLSLICSYFSADLSLTVLIKCVLNFEKMGICFPSVPCPGQHG